MGVAAVLFDLDNTLYPEAEFVRGGLAAAAQLCATYGVDPVAASARMYEIVSDEGRGHVFDSFIRESDVPPELVPEMVWAYRTHVPALSLYSDARDALMRCRERGYRTGIVTDGVSSVQWRKMQALGLDTAVDVVVCTHEIGPDFHKPSTVPFQICLHRLGCEASRAAYVADDASKDFAGPNALGMWTVQIDRPVELGFSKPARRAEDEPRFVVSDVCSAVERLPSVAGWEPA